MNTAVAQRAAIRLYRPWWQRLAAAWEDARARRAARDADREVRKAFAGLSEATLRDIGAPDWMHEPDPSPRRRWLEHGQW